jgi:EamA domain-containing membrane protein RarD
MIYLVLFSMFFLYLLIAVFMGKCIDARTRPPQLFFLFLAALSVAALSWMIFLYTREMFTK